jgi:hypothetical protein
MRLSMRTAQHAEEEEGGCDSHIGNTALEL